MSPPMLILTVSPMSLSVEEINAVFNNVDGSSRKQEFSQAIGESGVGSATASAYMAHKNA